MVLNKTDKEEEYEELAIEVTKELEDIDELIQDVVNKCVEVSSSEVTASIKFKVPAFIYPDDDFEGLKEKLLRLKQLSKDYGIDYLQNDEIDSAIKSLNDLLLSYHKEFDNYNEINDLRCGLNMDIELEPTILVQPKKDLKNGSQNNNFKV